ncbi:MAG: hypothetical protein QOK28_315 [Actinomycetota bacterium]|jgi:hypothetical protein
MRIPRGLLPAALALSSMSIVALAAVNTAPSQPVLAVGAPAAAPTTAAPSTTTTTSPPSPTTAAPRVTTPVAPRVTAPHVTAPPLTAPSTPAAPRPATTTPRPTGKSESCGWQWDAIRVDDGSSNEVTMYLDVARRPNETVTILADFAGPDSPTAAHTTITDGAGQATTKFTVSEDKRDWTIAISAVFPAGGVCAPQTFTLDY